MVEAKSTRSRVVGQGVKKGFQIDAAEMSISANHISAPEKSANQSLTSKHLKPAQAIVIVPT